MKRPEDTDRNLARIAYDSAPNPVVTPEQDSHQLHVFRCDLCGRIRDDSHRREPQSGICRECVEAAGFEEET